MPTDGVQLVSWIEIDGGDIGEGSTRGMGLGYMDGLEGYSGPRKRIKNE